MILYDLNLCPLIQYRDPYRSADGTVRYHPYHIISVSGRYDTVRVYRHAKFF